jgi:hypothetical protein
MCCTVRPHLTRRNDSAKDLDRGEACMSAERAREFVTARDKTRSPSPQAPHFLFAPACETAYASSAARANLVGHEPRTDSGSSRTAVKRHGFAGLYNPDAYDRNSAYLVHPPSSFSVAERNKCVTARGRGRGQWVPRRLRRALNDRAAAPPLTAGFQRRVMSRCGSSSAIRPRSQLDDRTSARPKQRTFATFAIG